MPPRQGTRVLVISSIFDKAAVRSYLEDSLHFFPDGGRRRRASDGVPINGGRHDSGGQLYRGRGRGPTPAPAFTLGGQARSSSICAAGVYHQGVKVQACFAVLELALLDFPGAVELTEGRDTLKPGPLFHAVAVAFFRRLASIARDASMTDAARHRIAELAGQISALMLEGAGFAEVANELADVLLGDARYLVGPDRKEALLGFLGASYSTHLFVPESFWSAREWCSFLPGERELLTSEIVVEPIQSLASFATDTRLEGLRTLAARSPQPELMPVALARGRRPPGPLPCLGTRNAVLIRADSAIVATPRTWSDHYALKASFNRAAGVREPDLERDIIVTTPIRVSGIAA